MAQKFLDGAEAGLASAPEIAAGAGIGREDELEIRRKSSDGTRPNEGDHPFLERLAERLKDIRSEFGGLVEKEHAAVRETDLARARRPPSADHALERGGMVGRAKRRPLVQGSAADKETRKGIQRRHRDCVSVTEVGQETGKTASGHRLPRAGRAAEEEVMASGRSYLEGAPEERLAS
jgi:hypothetical protein